MVPELYENMPIWVPEGLTHVRPGESFNPKYLATVPKVKSPKVLMLKDSIDGCGYSNSRLEIEKVAFDLETAKRMVAAEHLKSLRWKVYNNHRSKEYTEGVIDRMIATGYGMDDYHAFRLEVLVEGALDPLVEIERIWNPLMVCKSIGGRWSILYRGNGHNPYILTEISLDNIAKQTISDVYESFEDQTSAFTRAIVRANQSHIIQQVADSQKEK